METVQLADIFQDSMVLQREKPIYLWGTGISGTALTIQLGTYKTACVVEKGHFLVGLPPMEAARNLTLSITVEQEAVPSIILKDISIGDVYLAAGQSNMEYFLRYEAHFDELRREEENPDIHMYQVPRIAYEGQTRILPDSGYWFKKSDNAWRTFSSIGYLFAKSIQEETGVPIGIIGCNWGGTPAAAWIEERYLQEEPLTVFRQEYENEIKGKTEEALREESLAGWELEDSYRHQLEWRAAMYGFTLEEQAEWAKEHEGEAVIPMGPYHQWRPFGLYYTMIRKIAPYALKGVLWYQGESDEGHADIYDETFRALTDCWRATWRDPELPFLTVQVAPFGEWMGCNGERFPIVRESQERAAQTIPNVYMASIMDLGMYEDIHPKEKSEVARRLALLAKQHIYGLPVCGEPPCLKEIIRIKDQLILSFEHAGEGLVLKGSKLNALYVRQEDHEAALSDIEIQKDKVILTCEPLTEQEVQVSFAWEAYCEVNLYNSLGLSVKPFRYETGSVK